MINGDSPIGGCWEGRSQAMIIFRGFLIILMRKEGYEHQKTGSSLSQPVRKLGVEKLQKLRTAKYLNKICCCITVGGTNARNVTNCALGIVCI